MLKERSGIVKDCVVTCYFIRSGLPSSGRGTRNTDPARKKELLGFSSPSIPSMYGLSFARLVDPGHLSPAASLQQGRAGTGGGVWVGTREGAAAMVNAGLPSCCMGGRGGCLPTHTYSS